MAVGQIDALELRIAYSAGNAAEGIKKLATSLGELKSILLLLSIQMFCQ